ncbi:hypothetical protein ACS5PK_19520 [Roseateles sp. DB2]|uniref:hypothetical protein n=1 Tax=Roseateles sp. DB2 TaxID=3453717 RepID=UPI003EED3C78
MSEHPAEQHEDHQKAITGLRSEPQAWTLDDIDRLGKQLAGVPPPATRLTQTEALKRIARDLLKMRERGRTANSIAAALAERGLKVRERAVARVMADASKPKRSERSRPPSRAAG